MKETSASDTLLPDFWSEAQVTFTAANCVGCFVQK